jgi:AhpC/TSA family
VNRRRALTAMLASAGLLGSIRLVAAAQGPAEVGKPAPAFKVPDAEGRIQQLADFAGKPVVLEWTSPSCPFVRAQYQSGVMQELQKRAAKQGAVWLSVLSTHPSRRDYLPAGKAKGFHQGRGAASTALLIDAEGTMGKAYGAVVTPHIFIVGADGRLVYAGATGDKSTTSAQEVRGSRNFIREALADLAAGRKVATPTSRPFGCTVAYQG